MKHPEAHTPRVGVLGASGRMGVRILRLLESEFPTRATVGAQARRSTTATAFDGLSNCDVVIDFSLPEATMGFLDFLEQSGSHVPALVVGTTGWKPEQLERVRKFASRTALLVSANFSTGVYALRKILRDASPLLLSLGYEAVMTETHHNQKKDAPSGTALALAREMGDSLQSEIQSIRAGGVVGDHFVTFYGASDRIVIGHQAQDRDLFARGAIDAALWLARKRHETPGLKGWFEMDTFVSEYFGAQNK